MHAAIIHGEAASQPKRATPLEKLKRLKRLIRPPARKFSPLIILAGIGLLAIGLMLAAWRNNASPADETAQSADELTAASGKTEPAEEIEPAQSPTAARQAVAKQEKAAAERKGPASPAATNASAKTTAKTTAKNKNDKGAAAAKVAARKPAAKQEPRATTAQKPAAAANNSQRSASTAVISASVETDVVRLPRVEEAVWESNAWEVTVSTNGSGAAIYEARRPSPPPGSSGTMPTVQFQGVIARPEQGRGP